MKRGNLLSAMKYAEGIGISVLFSSDEHEDTNSNEICIQDDLSVEEKVCLVLKKCVDLKVKDSKGTVEAEAEAWKKARLIAKNNKITINDDKWFEFSIDSIIQLCNQQLKRDNK
jgi:hypothetical protein